MPDRLRYVSIVFAAGVACLTIGCANEVGDSPSVAIATPAVVPANADAAAAETATSAEVLSAQAATSAPAKVQAVADSASEPAGKISATAVAEYKAPFPDRVDLFVAPKRQGSSAAQTSGDNAVELMGFVRVDRQRAVLAINGEITPLAEGESRFGVEVISVRPPMVVLQRGRQRWQATLD